MGHSITDWTKLTIVKKNGCYCVSNKVSVVNSTLGSPNYQSEYDRFYKFDRANSHVNLSYYQ